MANQRRDGKKLIGAHIIPKFMAAVDRVRTALPRPEDRSTFIKVALAEACRSRGEEVPDEWVYDLPALGHAPSATKPTPHGPVLSKQGFPVLSSAKAAALTEVAVKISGVDQLSKGSSLSSEAGAPSADKPRPTPNTGRRSTRPPRPPKTAPK